MRPLNFGQMLGNSFIITITSVIGAVVSSTIVAFGFSRLRWRGRDQIFVLVILTMIIPGEVVLTPLVLYLQPAASFGYLVSHHCAFLFR